MRFIFSHGGRALEPDQTPEEVGMEAGDEILAVELMDLTEGPGTEVVVGGIPFFSTLSPTCRVWMTANRLLILARELG